MIIVIIVIIMKTITMIMIMIMMMMMMMIMMMKWDPAVRETLGSLHLEPMAPGPARRNP